MFQAEVTAWVKATRPGNQFGSGRIKELVFRAEKPERGLRGRQGKIIINLWITDFILKAMVNYYKGFEQRWQHRGVGRNLIR